MRDIGIRREYLAQERTHLANERTLLAYIRTSLTLIIFGAAIFKFLPSKPFVVIAILAMVFGVIIFIFGTRRFLNVRNKINRS